METLKEKVYYLAANEHKTDQEIADILSLDKSLVNKWINELKKPSAEFYNLALYNKIIFERNYMKNFIDKDFLEDIVNLSSKGMTFIEIAALFNTTESFILNALDLYNKKSSSIYNPDFYCQLILNNSKNMKKSESELFKKFNGLVTSGVNITKISKASIVKKFYRKQNARRIIEILLESNFTATDQYISKVCGVSPSFVSEVLRGKDEEKLGYLLFGKTTMKMIIEKRCERTENNRDRNKLTYSSNRSIYFEKSIDDSINDNLDEANVIESKSYSEPNKKNR